MIRVPTRPVQPERCYDLRAMWKDQAADRRNFPYQPGDFVSEPKEFESKASGPKKKYGEAWCPSWHRPQLHEGKDACCGCDGRGHILGLTTFQYSPGSFYPPMEDYWTVLEERGRPTGNWIVMEQGCRYCETTGDMAVTYRYVREMHARDAAERARKAAIQAYTDQLQRELSTRDRYIPPLQPERCYDWRKTWEDPEVYRRNFQYRPGDILTRRRTFWKAAAYQSWCPSWRRPRIHEGQDACIGCDGTGAVLGMSRNRFREFEIIEQGCRYCEVTGDMAITNRYLAAQASSDAAIERARYEKQRALEERYPRPNHKPTGYGGGPPPGK